MPEGQIAPIVISREVRASTERAWAALVEPDLVARWFTDATPVGEPGEPYRLDFGDSAVVGTVTELVPEKAFAYTWTWEYADPPLTTSVRWTVEAIPGGGSRVTLLHDGWADAGADAAERDDHAAYWEGYLDDLAELLDQDTARPDAPPRS